MAAWLNAFKGAVVELDVPCQGGLDNIEGIAGKVRQKRRTGRDWIRPDEERRQPRPTCAWVRACDPRSRNEIKGSLWLALTMFSRID